MAEQALTPQQMALSSNFQRVFMQQQQQQHQQHQQHQQPQQHQQFHAGNRMNSALNSDQNPNQNFSSQEAQLFQLYQNFNQQQAPSNPQVVASSSASSAFPISHSESQFRGAHNSGVSGEDHSQSRAMLDQYRSMIGGMLPEAGNGAGGDRLMLQSKVEPFTRDSNPTSINDDSDLWKVFDDDFAQQNSSSMQMQMHKKLNLSLNNFAFPSQNHYLEHHATPPQLQTSNDVLSDHESHLMWQPPQMGHQDQDDDPLPDHLDYNSEPFILPSTMIPPSVLAFSSSSESKKREANRNAPAQKRKRLKQIQPSVTPQAFLEQIIAQRGHSYQRIASDDAEYDAVPSALQLASFGTQLVKAVHTGDTGLLAQLLECGLSSNPCNQFRDSIVDLVCKRANESIFTCLLEHNCDLQVVDGFGRTPLHHACWASTFSASIVEQILQRDPIQLCIEDKHGQTPLEYVRSELTDEWISFLEHNIIRYFDPPPVLQSPKQRRPEGTLMDPPNSIGVSLAALVSAGSISPAQIAQMDDETRRTYKTKG